MWKTKDEFIVRCACRDIGDLIHLQFDSGYFDFGKDTEPELNHPMLEIGLEFVRGSENSFWYRLRQGLRFAFKKVSGLSGITVEMTDPVQRKEIARLALWLHRCVKDSQHTLDLMERQAKGEKITGEKPKRKRRKKTVEVEVKRGRKYKISAKPVSAVTELRVDDLPDSPGSASGVIPPAEGAPIVLKGRRGRKPKIKIAPPEEVVSVENLP